MFTRRVLIVSTLATAATLGAVQFSSHVSTTASSGSIAAITQSGSTSSYIIRARNLAAARQATQLAGGLVTHELGIIDAVAADLTPTQLKRLRLDPGLTITANRVAHVAGTSGTIEPYVVARTGANRLHASGITGRGVTIAFLDTGWWSQHATQTDTAGKNAVLQGYDAIGDKLGVGAPSDGYGHGTHVLSIAANSAIDQSGKFIGMAPDASRVVVRAFDKKGGGSYATTIRGIDWILKNAAQYKIRVVNMSFGATPESYYWDDPLAQAVMKLWQAGIVVVASAGNEGPGAQSIAVPGNVPYVITVGATTDNYTGDPTDDRLASFSSTGPTYEGFVKPEVVAPGGHVIAVLQSSSTLGKAHPSFLGTNGYLGSSYFYMSGTSMSAAVVSGTVALILQAQPSLTPDQVKCKLMSAARPAVNSSGALAYSVFQQGAGEINAYDAVFAPVGNCANNGLDINADVAGTAHFAGTADLDEDGNYFVSDDGVRKTSGDGLVWDQGYSWSKGYPWSQGYAWSRGYAWSKGYVWSRGYAWSRSFLWSSSLPWDSQASVSSSMTAPASINSWVENE